MSAVICTFHSPPASINILMLIYAKVPIIRERFPSRALGNDKLIESFCFRKIVFCEVVCSERCCFDHRSQSVNYQNKRKEQLFPHENARNKIVAQSETAYLQHCWNTIKYYATSSLYFPSTCFIPPTFLTCSWPIRFALHCAVQQESCFCSSTHKFERL